MKTKTGSARRMTSLAELKTDGARARVTRIAQHGLPVDLPREQLSKMKKDAAQYRACIALLWDEARVLTETGWSRQYLIAVQGHVDAEDREANSKRDPRLVFAEYTQRQIQCVRELEDLSEIFRAERQFSALVGAVKARSEIIERMLRTGQELGVISKAAKKVEVGGEVHVDVTTLSVHELKVHVAKEMEEMNKLLGLPRISASSGAGAVSRRLLGSASVEDDLAIPRTTTRVKRLINIEPNEDETAED